MAFVAAQEEAAPGPCHEFEEASVTDWAIAIHTHEATVETLF